MPQPDISTEILRGLAIGLPVALALWAIAYLVFA